jgi:hypothetical protein
MPFNTNKKSGITKQTLNPPLKNIRSAISMSDVLRSYEPTQTDKNIELLRNIEASKIDLTQLIAHLQNMQTDNIRRSFRGYKVSTINTLALSDLPDDTLTTIPYTIAEFEDVNYDLVKSQFVAPHTGFYTFRVFFFFEEESPATDRSDHAFNDCFVDVYKNDVAYERLDFNKQMIKHVNLHGSALIYLKAGDIADIRMYYLHAPISVFMIKNAYSRLDINYEGCNTELTGDAPVDFPPILTAYDADLQ